MAVEEDDLQTLEMFYDPRDLKISALRSPKPLSHTAENITVVTSAEIEAMAAHTLADVLANVPGLQTEDRGSIGTFTGVSLQGAKAFHVRVLIDGITTNFAGDGTPDIAAIPVRHIERIEIIKGPASSYWGSALGGVVNIVTRSPDADNPFTGYASTSVGEKGTYDLRGEASGTASAVGYYLYGGRLASDGIRPHTPLSSNSFYGKLRYDTGAPWSLLFSLGFTEADTGGALSREYDFSMNDRKRNLFFTASLHQHLLPGMELEARFRTDAKDFDSLAEDLSTGEPLSPIKTRERSVGGSVHLSWNRGINTLAAGVDYDYLKSSFGPNLAPGLAINAGKWGLFVNDTLVIGPVAVTPGIRYDHMDSLDDFISPSLGIAWSVHDDTTLRAYVGRGHSLPLMLPGLDQEKVVATQLGVESTRIPCLWLKANLFRNDLSNVQAYDEEGNVFHERQRKQGVDLEARTTPFLHTSFSGGYAFVDAENRPTGRILRGIPRHIAKLGIHYDDRQGLRGSIWGRHVFWNSRETGAKDEAAVIDLTASKRIAQAGGSSLEAFFAVHNLFNSSQYLYADYARNAGRWVEGGVRISY